MRDQRPMLSLEGLRFISSVAIVMFHYVPYATNVAWIGKLRIAVDLFFVISGIVIATHYDGRISTPYDYLDFMKRRIARIYPLHLATLAFYVAIGFLMVLGAVQPTNPSKYNFSELLPNLMLIHAWSPNSVSSFNYVSWSISAEFFVYLLFPAILWVVGRDFFVGLAGVGVTLAAGIALSHSMLNLDLVSLDCKLGIVRAVPSFAFGVFLSRYRLEIARMVAPNACWLGLHSLCVVIIGLMAIGASDYALLVCVYGIVGCAFVCDLSRQRTVVSLTPISSLGYLTYSVYMLHTVVATVLLAVLLPMFLGTSQEMMLVAVGTATLATLALAVLSYRYFEEPLRRRINHMAPFPRAELSPRR